jgi:hypothetical protein
MISRILIGVLCMGCCFSLSAQPFLLPDGRLVVPATLLENDTIPSIMLPEFEKTEWLTAEDLKRRQYLARLRKNIIKVWPYAKMASVMLKDMNEKLETMKSGREKKKFIKVVEKQMKKNFENELKNLTYSQGKLLIKLVDRETDETTYQIVKDLRGTFVAMFWQGMAKIFNSNLKTEYDSTGTDRDIENIIKSLERGEMK